MKTINLLKNSLPENCKISKIKKWNGRYDFDFSMNGITIRSSIRLSCADITYIYRLISNCIDKIMLEEIYE